jgi:hypothetical protein
MKDRQGCVGERTNDRIVLLQRARRPLRSEGDILRTRDEMSMSFSAFSSFGTVSDSHCVTEQSALINGLCWTASNYSTLLTTVMAGLVRRKCNVTIGNFNTG